MKDPIVLFSPNFFQGSEESYSEEESEEEASQWVMSSCFVEASQRVQIFDTIC